MPGLVGAARVSADDEKTSQAVLQMRGMIAHKDFYVNDPVFSDSRVCGARSHNNVIQKSPQPCSDSGLHVWLDGEFYNQEELKGSFKVGFDTDPEALHRLYRKDENFSFLTAVDGIYAAVIYDADKQKIHLVTDRYGLRPLYWTVHEKRLVWASEVKAMLALPGYRAKIDPQSVSDFIRFGHLLGDRTWFEDVRLLPEGTVLSWNLKDGTSTARQYVRWSEVRPMDGRLDEEGIAEELGRLFIRSVEARDRRGERVGLQLSGGLDSRVILAAMPDRGEKIAAFTFGTTRCDDIRIASRASRVKGASHHVAEINSDNWLMPRIEGVWWTDGQMDLLHMHGIEFLGRMKELFDVTLNGFLGDALLGGSYFNDPRWSAIEKFHHRGRRFVAMGSQPDKVFFETRMPFFDNKFMDLTLRIPERLRKDSYIYKKMLLKFFPKYFKTIPWQKTGMPISWPRIPGRLLHYYRRASAAWSRRDYADYPQWIRLEPNRSFFVNILTDKGALYPEYVGREKVMSDLDAHFKGENRAEALGRALTLEIWLRQVFSKTYRSGGISGHAG